MFCAEQTIQGRVDAPERLLDQHAHRKGVDESARRPAALLGIFMKKAPP
jgi:hypothetical protein